MPAPRPHRPSPALPVAPLVVAASSAHVEDVLPVLRRAFGVRKTAERPRDDSGRAAEGSRVQLSTDGGPTHLTEPVPADAREVRVVSPRID